VARQKLPRCKQCGGKLQPLGWLGKLFWARCENCGWDDPVELEEENDE
jgi:hypothetical protein